jgi:hypothetical protein
VKILLVLILIIILEQSQNNIILLSGEQNEISNIIFSVYTRAKRLPEPEELLMCNEFTQLEDVVLLFRRWKMAGLYKRSKRIYCLGNIQYLNYTLQCLVVDSLKKFLPAKDSALLVK